jgi:trk system potassium uptake protein TrkA
MKIIIAGAGEVGQYLAKILVKEQHDVTVIDANERKVEMLNANLDALVIHGSGNDSRTLEVAGIAEADLFAAVTNSDEVNLLACLEAKNMGQVRTMARVSEGRYLATPFSASATKLGIDFIVGPERAVAAAITKLLRTPGVVDVDHLADEKIALVELEVTGTSDLIGYNLVSADLPQPSLIAAIKRGKKLFVPRGGAVLEADDVIYLLTRSPQISQFVELAGHRPKEIRHVLVIGCGNIGFQVTKELDRQGYHPVVIEKNPEVAEWVARHLPKTRVIKGDGTNLKLLKEQVEGGIDSVVTLLEDNHKSLVISAYMKNLGVYQVIARVDDLEFEPLAHKMGIMSLVSPTRAVAESILGIIRHGRETSTRMLGDNQGEIIEFEMGTSHRAKGLLEKPLSQLHSLPEGSIIGIIVRGDEVIIPRGSDQILEGDRIIVFAMLDTIPQIQELFE